jgi:5-methylcytosine-specific restriction endonuclease McrA
VSLAQLDLCSTPDHALLEGLKTLALRGAELEADLLVHLGEVDSRGLALELGFRSLFSYSVEVLHFSESVAFHRITAARAARRFPQILERIRSGELHLSGLRLLLPQLTAENCGELLDLARHQSKRAIEERLADRAPKPDVPAQLRRIPERTAISKPLMLDSPAPAPAMASAPTAGPVPTPAALAVSARPSAEPLGGSRYKVQFTAGAETHAKLLEAQALLRHQIPDGDLGRIFDRALDALLRDVRRVKFAETERPHAKRAEASGPASRHIPAAIRREVAERDGERCTFVAGDGRRCGTRDTLEFHHVVPFARAHRHRVDEITLRCRAHNAYAATQDFGAEHMARFRRDRASTVTRSGASCEE